MTDIVKKISYAMSLRSPQTEALSFLDAISSFCDYKKDSKSQVEKVASEHCEGKRQIKVADEFSFPSFCYHMATGIGKTRLMGACIYYLYKTKGYKHFFILAPGNTIYEKLRKETEPSHPKYLFKGLEAEMGRPKVYDGENYTSYPVQLEQMTLPLGKTSEIQLFIFNIGKIFNSKTDTQFNFHKFKETLGASFSEVLAGFDDLVVCMDEAHRYYAPASMKAINFLKPILSLEFTATPKCNTNIIYAYGLARGALAVQTHGQIAEEILRIYGFNNVPNPHYIKNVITYGNQKTPDRIINTASDLLVGQGCVEIMSNSLTRSAYYDELTAYPAAHCVRIINPLSNELNVMRQTLLFNALEAVALNVNRRNGDLRLFEFGNCYFFDPAAAEQEGAKGTLKPYREERRLAITVTGLEHQPNWNRPKPQLSDFFTVKYLTEQLLQRFGVNIYEGFYETLSSDLYSEAVSYKIRGKQLFEMGVVSSKLARKTFDLKQPVYFMEMNVAHLQKIVETVRVQAVELSKYPEVKRDLALLVDKTVTFSQLREAASKAEKKLLKSVGLFDVYEGDKLPEGKKSYALSFVIEDTAKTLTDTEIDRIMSNIATALTKATGAQVRS